MQLFFSSLSELEHFTHRLQTLPKNNACEHCAQNDRWVSHGYVYKQRSMDCREVVGKRIVCSNRFDNTGCGRTRQLYLHTCVPGRRYSLQAIAAFILHLLGGLTVTCAYRLATHIHGGTRHAWRWLNALYAQLPRFRTLLLWRIQGRFPHFQCPRSLCRRLRILLPTLLQLDETFSLAGIQRHQQQAFF